MVAVLFNILGMILAALGLITPLFAIAFMVVSIFAILLNTLRVRAIDLEHEEAPSEEEGTLAELEFKVPNMVCEGCAKKIRNALIGFPGIREVRPQVPQKHVYVRYEPDKVSARELKDALEKTGFTTVEA